MKILPPSEILCAVRVVWFISAECVDSCVVELSLSNTEIGAVAIEVVVLVVAEGGSVLPVLVRYGTNECHWYTGTCVVSSGE